MKILFNILFFISFITIIAQPRLKIEVFNPSDFDRNNELVELSVSDLKERLPLNLNEVYIVQNANGETIPSQMTFDNKLIFESGLKTNQKKNYIIHKGTKEAYSARTFAAPHPERYDDFVWENDRVGFRVYGQKLKEIQAPMSGFDLWYKRTDRIVLDEWYRKELSKEASYHIDHGEGCDPYIVGQTLGAGNIAIVIDSTIILNENYTTFQILDNGPLRTSFILSYPSLTINGKTINEQKEIAIDAGSQLSKVTQIIDSNVPLTLATGFPKRAKGDSIVYTESNNYFIYEEPKDSINGQIYLGIIIPKGINEVQTIKQTKINGSDTILDKYTNVIATTDYVPYEPIMYYTGFGWSKYGYENVEAFDRYMTNFSKALSEPLQITFK